VATFLFIVLLNMASILITWQLGMELLDSEIHNTVYLAELFPVIFEFAVLLILFSFLHKRRIILERITVKRLLILIVVVNAVTFALGLVFFQYWPTPYNPYILGRELILESMRM
jgi:hypothetical protein